MVLIWLPGANSLFIRVLLDKKHARPYKVVDALVFHFIRLSNTYKARRAGDVEKLPVLWHQSLLVFCQRSAVSRPLYAVTVLTLPYYLLDMPRT